MIFCDNIFLYEYLNLILKVQDLKIVQGTIFGKEAEDERYSFRALHKIILSMESGH